MPGTLTHLCPICLDNIPLNECVTLDPCNHVFCVTCAKTWLKSNPTCALCRQMVESISPANEKEIEAQKKQTMDNFKEWLSKANLMEKDHQIDGLRWCINREISSSLDTRLSSSIYNIKAGGLIADEMGLGKTILSLGLIISNFLPRTLIVLPPSLIPQWTEEIVRLLGHTPLVYWGVNKSKITTENLNTAPIVITSYSHISCDNSDASGNTGLRVLHTYDWDRVIFDEAHHMRNCKMNYHGAMQLKSKITWLLTGTPIHNKITDLKAYFALLGVSMPKQTHDRQVIRCQYILQQILLRRTKEDAGIVLPKVHHHHVSVPWETTAEKDAAEQIHSMAGLFRVTHDNVDDAFRYLGQHILTNLIRSRQMCVLPSMLLGSMPDSSENQSQRSTLTTNSSKMNAVVRKLLDRKDNGRKKLVFCHFRQEIDHITHAIQSADISCAFFDGRISSAERRVIIRKSPDVLILQMKTACEGLNLQQYQEVYFVSPHWNPAVEDQAIGRCHRIGQKNEIDVFRFTMENFSGRAFTLDNFCMRVQEIKREMRDIIETPPAVRV